MRALWLWTGALALCANAFAQAVPEIGRLESELQQAVALQKASRKTFVTPATRGVGYAMYFNVFRRRVEALGTAEFPQLDGRKLYGKLVLSIPISAGGEIYEEEGGVKIERSSGNPELDQAAIRIVQRAAPFGKLPRNMLSPEKDDVWVLVAPFDFSHENGTQ